MSISSATIHSNDGMDCPVFLGAKLAQPVLTGMGIGLQQEGAEMHTTTVAVDLAKSVFQIALADDKWKVLEQHLLTRTQFERWFTNHDVSLVVMDVNRVRYQYCSFRHRLRRLKCDEERPDPLGVGAR